jgi:hypothetical protein
MIASAEIASHAPVPGASDVRKHFNDIWMQTPNHDKPAAVCIIDFSGQLNE